MSEWKKRHNRASSQHVGLEVAILAPDPKYQLERIAKALMRKPAPRLKRKGEPRLPTFNLPGDDE